MARTFFRLSRARCLLLPALVPALLPLPCRSQHLAQPSRIWSVGPLGPSEPVPAPSLGNKGAPLSGPSAALIQTGSSFASTRSVVFAGDRVVLAVDAGERQVDGTSTPAHITELISLDVKTGAVKGTRDLTNFGSTKLFATDDAHVVVSGAAVLRLTPDLQDAGSFDPRAEGHKHGRVQNISPDGSTLGDATSPGFELVDARTFKTVWLTEVAIVDTSVSDKGVLSDNVVSTDDPDDTASTVYTDSDGQHRLYHGKCGTRPVFLTNDLVLEQGCKDALILNLHGDLVRTLHPKFPWSFAGVSQDGRRFALQLVRPSTILSHRSERFVVYSVSTGDPLAELRAAVPPLLQSWTAFSPDGSLFVVGSPLKLTLYRLP